MVKELDSAGTVELAPSIRNGRRAVLVSLATGNTLLAGIAFGDRDVRVAIGTGPRDIVGRQRMPLPADHTPTRAWSGPRGWSYDLVEKAGKTMPDVRSVGVGLPAPVDSVSGQVGSEGILPGWRGVDVGRRDGGAASALRSSWTTRPTSPRSASSSAVRCRGFIDGVYIKVSLRRGCGPDPRWRAVPGQRGHRGRDRPPHHRRERPGLPVRQPRVPRDLHRRRRPA